MFRCSENSFEKGGLSRSDEIQLVLPPSQARGLSPIEDTNSSAKAAAFSSSLSPRGPFSPLTSQRRVLGHTFKPRVFAILWKMPAAPGYSHSKISNFGFDALCREFFGDGISDLFGVAVIASV
jgi:hypothetical protein